MIDREHDLSITKQAAALNISRGSVYYLPRPVSASDLKQVQFAAGFKSQGKTGHVVTRGSPRSR